MNRDGYVAADALAALAIVGLAIVGLLEGLHVIASAEGAVDGALAQAVGVRTATAEMNSLLGDRGPFRSDLPDFTGGAQAFSFGCGSGRCEAEVRPELLRVHGPGGEREVRLPGGRQLHFRYVGSAALLETWPPAPLPPPARSWQVLKAVVLEDATIGRPVAVARVWADQASGCEYDVVSQDCRRDAP